MMTSCLIARKRDDLTEEEWSFAVVGEQIVLDRYRYLERASKRHKHRAVRWYERLDHRSNTLKLDAVPLPDDVAEEALATVRARFRVVKEFQR